MAEPASSAASGIALSAGVITITGSFLGLQYDYLLAGMFGGLVALSFAAQSSRLRMAAAAADVLCRPDRHQYADRRTAGTQYFEKPFRRPEMSFLLIVNTMIGCVIVAHATCSINAMTRTTDHVYRLGYILLAVSALAVAIGPLYGYIKPLWPEVLFNAGAVLVLVRGARGTCARS